MPVELNHTIAGARDNRAAADFVTQILGLPEATTFGPFQVVETANGVSIDFITTDGDIAAIHYAFLITENEFDEIFGRITERGLDYWGDPHRYEPGEINHHDGGRGVYFEHPDGHLLEIITRPYGSGS